MRIVDTASKSGTVGSSVSSGVLLQSLLVLCGLRLYVRCFRSFSFSIIAALYTMCATCALFFLYLLCLLFSIFSTFLIFVDSLVLVVFINVIVGEVDQ
jgi:hypothetical protein